MGHATTETVTESETETETGSAGGRRQAADIVVVRCEARPGADEAQV